MKKGILIIIVGIIVIAGIWYGVKSSKNTTQPDTQMSQAVNTVSFACNVGKTIQAQFTEGAPIESNDSNKPATPGGNVKLVLSDGRSMTLPQTLSADGARYANADESFVFWSKGNGALVLENNEEKSYIGCIRVADVPQGSNLTKVYSNSQQGFSIRTPEGFTADESYKYQVSPSKVFSGVKFTIPASLAEGTNLSTDSYISVESIPQTQNCAANLFFDGTHTPTTIADGSESYSVATSSGAGAGNRYEETIYAIPGTNPCVAIRYFIHYGAIGNYPAGTVKEFDQAALIKQFDDIRRTLVVSQ